VSIETIYLGIPTACMMPIGRINLSPLLGKGVKFIASPEDLADFISKPKRSGIKEEIFCLDASLKRWKKLLKGITKG